MEPRAFAAASARRGDRMHAVTERLIRVLVVEDDAPVASGLVRGLRAAGMEVELATCGTQGARAARETPVDIVVLDLLLPEKSGFEVLEEVTARRGPPVIVLTACTDLPHRLQAFALGAVDFMAKPFFVEELLARIRSRLRVTPAPPNRRLAWGDAVVDLDARTVAVAGQAVAFTRTELDLLAYLAERPGRAVSRRQLAERILDPDETPDARTVDTHVARIRKKLGAAGSRVATVWGIGYRFDESDGP